MTNSNLYKRLGDYIETVNVRNRDLKDIPLMGLSINKVFIPSIANTIGSNMANYKVIERDYFAYGPVTSRNGEKITIALFKDYDEALMSQAYTSFKITKPDELLSDYLMMWFSRPEFDRYARYHSHGSARETFDWDAMCDVELPVPSIEKQQKIVAEYQAIENKIKTNEAICEKLEASAQALYKHWFVDFEFPCLPENYKFSGTGKPKDYTSILIYKRVGGLPAPAENTWFVYLILCEDDSIYKGMTNDLYRRFYEHYTGIGAEWTKVNKPIKVIHWEEFNSKEAAVKREKDLKTGYGRTWIQRQIEKAGGIDALNSGLPAPKTHDVDKAGLPAPKTHDVDKAGLPAPKTHDVDKAGEPAPKTQLRTAGKMVWNDELEKEIPEGWFLCDLSSLSNIKSSKRIYKREYRESGIPFYRGKEITLKKEGRNIDSPLFISKNRFDELKEAYGNPCKGDILMTAVGTIGSTYMVVDEEFYFKDGNIIWLNDFKIKGINFYLYDFMQTESFKDLLTEITIGSTQSAITISTFGSQKILAPTSTVISNYSYYSQNLHKLIVLYKDQNIKLRQFQEILLSRMVKEK